MTTPALLVVIALSQFTCAVIFDQSPWKGGGFGMFSSLDDPGNRWFRCFLTTAEAVIPCGFPRTPLHSALLAKTLPTRPQAREVATQLAQLTWSVRDFQGRYPELLQAAKGAVAPQTMEIDDESLYLLSSLQAMGAVRDQTVARERPDTKELVPARTLLLELHKGVFDFDRRQVSSQRQFAVRISLGDD